MFDISPSTTRIGLLTFGSRPQNHFQLDKFPTEDEVKPFSHWVTRWRLFDVGVKIYIGPNRGIFDVSDSASLNVKTL